MYVFFRFISDVQAVLKTREEYGFSQEDHLYMIPQSIFKLHPEYDLVLIKLLQKDPLV